MREEKTFEQKEEREETAKSEEHIGQHIRRNNKQLKEREGQ